MRRLWGRAKLSSKPFSDFEGERGWSELSTVDIILTSKARSKQCSDREEEIGKTISNTIKEKASNNSKYACKVCHRDKLDGSVFCARHTVAYVNIEAGFQKWRYALGYQWREYLEKLSKNTGTGVYAKEIIKDIIG